MNMNASLEEATDDADMPSNSVATVSRRTSFPLRTLMVCFTVWLIATEILVFDEIKFYANVEMIEQAAKALGRPQLIVPSERTPGLSDPAKMEKL